MNENVKVYVPSLNRSKICETHLYLPFIYYVVDPSEYDDYKKRHDNVICLPEGVQGRYARVCNWILNNAENEHLIIMDDDIKSINVYEKQKLIKLSCDGVIQFIEHAIIMVEDFGVRYWGLNINSDKGGYREYTPFSFTAYLGGPFQGHYNNECRYDENMLLKEDYDMTLQVLNKYRKDLRFNKYSFTCDQHGKPGGCANYRSLEREKKQNKLLQEKWGDKIVKQDTNSKQQYDINPVIKIPIKGV